MSMSFHVFCSQTESLNDILVVRTLVTSPVFYIKTTGGVFRQVQGVELASREGRRFFISDKDRKYQ